MAGSKINNFLSLVAVLIISCLFAEALKCYHYTCDEHFKTKGCEGNEMGEITECGQSPGWIEFCYATAGNIRKTTNVTRKGCGMTDNIAGFFEPYCAFSDRDDVDEVECICYENLCNSRKKVPREAFR